MTTRGLGAVTGALSPGAVLVLMIFAVLILVPVTLRSPLRVSPASAVFIVASVLGAILVVRRRWRDPEAELRALAVAGLVVVPGVISLALNADRPGLGAYVLGGLAPFVAIAMLLWALLPTRSQDVYVLIARLLVWASVPLALLAIGQSITDTWPLLDALNVREFTSDRYDERAVAIFGHPIVYGAVAGASALLAVALRPAWWTVALGLNVAAMALTGSRSAWVAFGVSVLVYLALTLSRRAPTLSWRQVLTATATAALVLGVVTLLPDFDGPSAARPPTRDGNAGSDGLPDDRLFDVAESESGQYRIQQWTGALERITANPQTLFVGHGPGSSFQLLLNEPMGPLTGPPTFDNTYLTIWYEQGAIGLLSLVGVLAVGIRRAGLAGRLLLLMIAVNVVFYEGYKWPPIDALALLAALLPKGAGAPVPPE